MMRFGVHCSIRKGLDSAVFEAEKAGCEALQIFTRSPRMWKHGFASKKDIEKFNQLRKIKNIHPLVIHTPYLPNLATSKRKLYKLSLDSLKDDLAFCERIKADYLVIHPGAYSENSSMKEGIRRISGAINKIFGSVKGKTVLLVENVAGGGRRVGRDFKEIAEIIKQVRNKQRIGVCFDTAHALGAGYALADEAGVRKTFKYFNEKIGIKKLKVVHFNDSKAELGSRKDRHDHIGKGHIGLKGFKYIVGALKNIAEAGILETPKDTPFSDIRNLNILFKYRGKKSK